MGIARIMSVSGTTDPRSRQSNQRKENGVLFPLASRHLPPRKLAELKAGFDRIETRRIGAGKHEAFHRMLQELEELYSQAA
jgi:hemerythrin-like domain-containing protein